MFGNKDKNIEQQVAFDIADLLKPERMFVNFGGTNNSKQIMSINSMEPTGTNLYDRTFKACKILLRDVLSQKNRPTTITDINRWNDLKLNRSVEMKLGYNIKLEDFGAVLGIDKMQLHEMSVSAINISPDKNKMYLLDETKKSFYEFNIGDKGKNLTSLIKEAEKDGRNAIPLVIFSDVNPLMYERSMSVPIVDTMPMLLVDKSIGNLDENHPPPIVQGFFNKDDVSRVTDSDGTISYTDREIWVRVDKKGTLEYFRANIRPEENTTTDLKKALEISADFIDKHMGFPSETYITDIQTKTIEGTKSNEYTFKFKYRYKNIPVMMENKDNNNIIEISVYGGEIRHYKRLVFNTSPEGEVKQILNPVDALDSLINSAGVIKFQDMYLAYLERVKYGKVIFTPVWVVTANVSNGQDPKGDKGQVKQFKINAESGYIME